MDDLAEFLLEQIAKEEADARALQRRAQEHELDCRDPRLLGTVIPGWGDWPRVQVMSAQVRAECEALRKIVEMHRPEGDDIGDGQFEFCSTCRETGPDSQLWPCATLLALALPYADRLGCREEWRP